jgi:putative SOS response-associated peptidase YedK
MCGRYSLTTPLEAMRQIFGFVGGYNLPARYNIAPTQDVPVVVKTTIEAVPKLVAMRWGLVPPWAKDLSIGAKMINARVETAATKPSFRAAFRRRHCIVPADGFYEWKTIAGSKQPFRISFADNTPFGFAGLWENWLDPGGDELLTCTILTTDASERLRSIHHRMPVILQPDNYDHWLNSENPFPGDLERPFESEALRFYPVSKDVNKPINDGPTCFEPVDLVQPEAKKPEQGSLF